jgi:glycosyltransferase involved in cell wall biosynthesis
VLGEGPERKNLEKLALELGISHKIAMPGTVNRETVREELQKSRAFLFSSNSESFGVAIIEAFAAGLPVLTTRCSGPEAFMNDDVGVMVPKQDEEAFFQGIKSLISRQFNEKVICNYARDHFHEKKVALKYKALYEGLC